MMYAALVDCRDGVKFFVDLEKARQQEKKVM